MRVTPRGGADRIDGAQTDEAGGLLFRARVRVAPEDGAANEALEALFAKALGVPRSSVAVARGAKARIKTLTIAGVEAGAITALAARFAAAPQTQEP